MFKEIFQPGIFYLELELHANEFIYLAIPNIFQLLGNVS